MITGEVLAKLKAAIPEEEISFKPQTFREDNGRQLALMVGYVDARWVDERLDQATDGDWSFEWESVLLTDNGVGVKGTLTVMGTVREDVGEYHRQGEHDDMEMLKAAVSDALKRAAVHFGVGRELYRMPTMWVAWDRRTRQPVDGEMDRVRKSLGQHRQAADRVAKGPQSDEPSGEARDIEGRPRWWASFWEWADKYNEYQHSAVAPRDVVIQMTESYGGKGLDHFDLLADAQAAYIKTFPSFAKSESMPKEPSTEGPVKWDSQTITRFWKAVREKGKAQKDVLDAMGGNITTYTGTWDDLMALVDGMA
jgi:hypothetical protein